jgi:hypothetical protein
MDSSPLGFLGKSVVLGFKNLTCDDLTNVLKTTVALTTMS